MMEQTVCPSPRVPRDQPKLYVLGRQLGRAASLSMDRQGKGLG